MSDLSVCVSCRAVIPAGGGCGVDPAHATVSLAAAAGRAALVEVVWGPAEERRYTLRELQRGTGGQRQLSVAGMAIAAGGMIFLGSVSMALIGGAAGAAAGHLLGYLRARRRVPDHPRGAEEVALPGRAARGRIRRAESVESPASGSPCAVWAIELRFEGPWGERAMLRAAATGGLDVVLDGGAAARVPAGPVVLVAPMSQLDDIESIALDDYLREIDPSRTDDPEPFPPIPYNVVVEHTVMSGDRIELLGELIPDVLPSGRQRLYRDAPATVLVPSGMPILRVA